MQIFIARNNQQLGPFDLATIQAQLNDGSLAPSDLAWYEGAAGWAPLSTVPGIVISAPPVRRGPPPPPTIAPPPPPRSSPPVPAAISPSASAPVPSPVIPSAAAVSTGAAPAQPQKKSTLKVVGSILVGILVLSLGLLKIVRSTTRLLSDKPTTRTSPQSVALQPVAQLSMPAPTQCASGLECQFVLSATDLFTLCLKDPSIVTDKRYVQRRAAVSGTVLRVVTSNPTWPYLDLDGGAPDRAVRCFFYYGRELAGVAPGQHVSVQGIFEGATFVRKELPSVSKTDKYLFFSICKIERDTTTTTSTSSPPPSQATTAANTSGLEGEYVETQNPANTLSIKAGQWRMHVADIDIDYTSAFKKTADKTYEFSLAATNPAFKGLKTTMIVRQDGAFIVLKETGVANETKYKKK
jgi:hypothetical protein